MPWYDLVYWNANQVEDITDHLVVNGAGNGLAARKSYVTLPVNADRATLGNAVGKPIEKHTTLGTAGAALWDVMPRPFVIEEIYADVLIDWVGLTTSSAWHNNRIVFVLQRMDSGSNESNVFVRREGAPGMRDQDVQQMAMSSVYAPRGTFTSVAADHVQQHRVRIRITRPMRFVSTDHQMYFAMYRPAIEGSNIVKVSGAWRCKASKIRPKW